MLKFLNIIYIIIYALYIIGVYHYQSELSNKLVTNQSSIKTKENTIHMKEHPIKYLITVYSESNIINNDYRAYNNNNTIKHDFMSSTIKKCLILKKLSQ